MNRYKVSLSNGTTYMIEANYIGVVEGNVALHNVHTDDVSKGDVVAIFSPNTYVSIVKVDNPVNPQDLHFCQVCGFTYRVEYTLKSVTDTQWANHLNRCPRCGERDV